MIYALSYTPEAEEQLNSLHEWITEHGSVDRADRFVAGILDLCQTLSTFPHLGSSREDVQSGLRVISYRKRVVIAYAVYASTVEIAGIYYGGRDYETLIRDGLD